LHNGYAAYESDREVAAGKMFPFDTFLKPNERIVATRVVLVPVGMFDILEVTVQMPTTSKEDKMSYRAEYTSGFHGHWYRKHEEGNEEEFEVDDNGHSRDGKTEMQFSHAVSQILLSEADGVASNPAPRSIHPSK
jgi:hypothetical protein